MRALSILALALCVTLAAASAIPERTRKVADKDLLTKQKNILQLLIRVHQPTYIPELQSIAKSFELEKNTDHFSEWALPYVHKLCARYEQGNMLPRGQVFSVVYKKHIKEAVLLFNVLYGAKDYDTFFKTAVWMREHFNEGQFVYALSVAVIHREDTHDVVLPPPYEIYPEMFVNTQVIHKAVEAKLQGKLGETVTINAAHVDNSSAWWLTYPKVQHPTDLLKYFTEDVGLSTYHTYLHYEYPYWFSAQKYGEKPAPRRGEVFYYTLQQMASRYYLERLSNGLPDTEPATYDMHYEHMEAYAPHMRYYNGLAFPSRPEDLTVSNIDLFDIEAVHKVERRLQNAIDLGVAFDTEINKVALDDKDGIDILGNLISGNKDSINKKFYGNIYMYLRLLYGHITDPEHEHGVAPSVLEHFETAMRDPVYYRIVERILKLFHQYKALLHSYTRDELIFPGVKIENVETDKLVTFVDEYVFDLNSFLAVASDEEAHKLDIRVRQPRLNHKPFSVRVTVDSDKNTRVGVRFFLAPKYDYLGHELSLEERRQHAVEIDRFLYDLKSGKNTIERSSRDSNAVVPDQTITRVLLKKVEDGLQGREPFYVDSSHRHCGFPERLLLPKGSRQGTPFTLFVAISPFSGESMETHRAYVSCGAGFGYQKVDDKPLGFPLDRVIKNHEDFFVPNFYAEEVIVFHKKQEEANKA
uniref:Hexamerin-like protein 1 n=1 Tax=Gryllotalpa sp. XZ-2017 TaxID=2057962 RepID=A0A2I6SDD4_9ORTH|nr:hexamerin-like protein 1 [Gryllotalpa sp. XZ-2017]